MTPPASWQEPLRELYDCYYGSQDYDTRYPRPNAGTWRFLCDHGFLGADLLLDLGCGSGRYAVPLLQSGQMWLVGCDISAVAIERLDQRLRELGLRDRAQLMACSLASLPPQMQFDAIVLLFGVLSHLGTRVQRVQALRDLRGRIAPGGRLALSVPCLWRRRPLEVLRAWLRAPGGACGDISFERWIDGRWRTFFYHLYTPRTLREELAEAGWSLSVIEAESLLPEWLVTQWPVFSRIDDILARRLPAALGYGLRALALPA